MRLHAAVHGRREQEDGSDEQISIAVDAAAAISFAQGTAKRSRMKYIDMRQQWVQLLRNRDEIAYTKVLGTENDADYFTKVHPRPKHLEFEARLMKRLPR